MLNIASMRGDEGANPVGRVDATRVYRSFGGAIFSMNIVKHTRCGAKCSKLHTYIAPFDTSKFHEVELEKTQKTILFSIPPCIVLVPTPPPCEQGTPHFRGTPVVSGFLGFCSLLPGCSSLGHFPGKCQIFSFFPKCSLLTLPFVKDLRYKA